jgi:hypothetical protein
MQLGKWDVERSETHQIRVGKMMGFPRVLPILPRCDAVLRLRNLIEQVVLNQRMESF